MIQEQLLEQLATVLCFSKVSLFQALVARASNVYTALDAPHHVLAIDIATFIEFGSRFEISIDSDV